MSDRYGCHIWNKGDNEMTGGHLLIIEHQFLTAGRTNTSLEKKKKVILLRIQKQKHLIQKLQFGSL